MRQVCGLSSKLARRRCRECFVIDSGPADAGAVVSSVCRYGDFCHTEMWLLLSLVKGSRFQPLQRSCYVIRARRAIRSSSEGHT